MKVAILSQDASIYSTKRLTEACLQRGHEVQVVDFLRCTLLLHPHHAQMWHKGSLCPHFDVVIPRIGPAKAL
ncbi:MAG TPA: 30S ribosomal protein S6--L-glutamate ligase, partial [Stenomitos sp.]